MRIRQKSFLNNRSLKFKPKPIIIMNILLLYPAFPDTFWSFKHALKFIRKKASLPPLGLITIAAMLPKDWPVRLVDSNIRQLTPADLSWADYVFISAIAVQKASALELIKFCQAAGKKIVAGGPLFAAEPEQFQEVDHLVLFEAELTLPLFLNDLKHNKAQRFYATSEYCDMEQSPLPRWDLLDRDAYVSMCVQFSRGCPFDCEFCNITHLLGRIPRVKTAKQIIAELDALYSLGWRGNVFFVDDNLIGNKTRLKAELLPALISWQKKTGHRLSFSTEASINLADDRELTRQMVNAGFNTVFIGIETPDQTALAECGKTQNQRRDLVSDVKKLQATGLQVQGGFIVGFDSDDLTIFQRQFDFIMQSGVVTAMVGLLNAMPGTKLLKRLKQAGRLLGETSGNNVDGTTNFIPRMGMDKLREGYRDLMEYLYKESIYYQRVRTFLREYRTPDLIHAYKGLNLQRLLAFFRACWHLGLKKPGGRFGYWFLLIWVFFRKPRHIPLAVEMAISGHHIRLVVEKLIK